jgi:hypothetical protein
MLAMTANQQQMTDPAETLRFACTSCGQCCNRSPEVELSETLDLADAFVFRLMFRPYELALGINDYLKTVPTSKNSALKTTASSQNVACLKVKRFGRTSGSPDFQSN